MAPFFLDRQELKIGSTTIIGKGNKRASVEVLDETNLFIRTTNDHPVYAGEANADGAAFVGHVHAIRHDTVLTRESVSTRAKAPEVVWKERE